MGSKKQEEIDYQNFEKDARKALYEDNKGLEETLGPFLKRIPPCLLFSQGASETFGNYTRVLNCLEIGGGDSTRLDEYPKRL